MFTSTHRRKSYHNENMKKSEKVELIGTNWNYIGIWTWKLELLDDRNISSINFRVED